MTNGGADGCAAGSQHGISFSYISVTWKAYLYLECILLAFRKVWCPVCVIGGGGGKWMVSIITDIVLIAVLEGGS